MTTNFQDQARALGDPTRYDIFRHIADAAGPVSIAELNEHFAVNHNAIRQHLAKLVAARLVRESKVHGGGRGRPYYVYEVNPAVDSRWGTTSPYERLSQLLVEMIRTGLDPEAIGHRAADDFRVAPPSGDGVADISAAMARHGFEPEIRDTRGGPEIVLHECPYTAVALADRATVCALHLGIAQGLADGTEVRVTELVAYDPRQADCRLRLRIATEDPVAIGRLSLRGRSR